MSWWLAQIPQRAMMWLGLVLLLGLLCLVMLILLVGVWRRYNRRLEIGRGMRHSKPDGHIDIWKTSGRRLIVPLPKPPTQENPDEDAPPQSPER